MADGTLFPKAREVVLNELLTNGKRATCWVERGAFQDLSMGILVGVGVGVGRRLATKRHSGVWAMAQGTALTAWWGPAYQYANVTWPQRSMSEEVQALKARVEALAAFAYNGVLVNGYRDGQDSMGWHRDNEPEIDQTSIASLSLGASRTFKVRDRRTKAVVNIELHHGDLLIMEHLQEVHEHSVPKRAKVSASRMNFTFRRLV